jgi:dihydroorotase (homodimeric type)
MTLYLTDRTPAAEIAAAKASGFVVGVKYYPAGATTNSETGVTNWQATRQALAAMEQHGVPLLVHGEVTDADVDVFDRERVFLERHLIPLHREFPALRIVLEHVTTAEAVAWVEQAGARVGATITAHHLLWNRNAVFQGGIRPHAYCLPVLKRERHREALVKAAVTGSRFFLGTDSAPHARNRKEAACGCAGHLHGARSDRALRRGLRARRCVGASSRRSRASVVRTSTACRETRSASRSNRRRGRCRPSCRSVTNGSCRCALARSVPWRLVGA